MSDPDPRSIQLAHRHHLLERLHENSRRESDAEVQLTQHSPTEIERERLQASLEAARAERRYLVRQIGLIPTPGRHEGNYYVGRCSCGSIVRAQPEDTGPLSEAVAELSRWLADGLTIERDRATSPLHLLEPCRCRKRTLTVA